jgi:CelD/BcsL family acetyltransferase involved in cellulose biosynthesis
LIDGVFVKVTVLDQVPEDPATVSAWNNLVLQMERPEVFFSQQWAWAASRAFSESLRPLIFLIHDDGPLVGVAALATNPESPETASFLTASTADYCDLVSEPERRAAIWTIVSEETQKMGIRGLVLANVPAESRTLRALKTAAKSCHLHFYQRRSYDCGLISLRDEEERQNVLQFLARKEIERRGLKKLGQLGPVRVNHLSAERLDAAVRSIELAHISRFLAARRLSPLIGPERRLFLKELGRSLSAAGWLKISELEVNGRAIAWNYGFQFCASWFWYLPTFRMEYEKLSPGFCLIRLLAKEACSDLSVERLDLGLGNEAYKKRVSNAIFSTRYVLLSSSLLPHLTTIARHGAVTTVGRFPAVDRKIRRGRDWFDKWRSRIQENGLAATAVHSVTMARRRLAGREEIVFFEAPDMLMPDVIIPDESVVLKPIGWEDLALAAIDHARDHSTLDYLMRCGQRLRKGRATGYLLQDTGTQDAFHFLWVDAYDGFQLSEINTMLESEDPGAAMIFDCWTPTAQRGCGRYAAAIRLAAASLQKQQKRAWIFSEAKNAPSVRGIVAAGFQYRFSLVRTRVLFRTTLTQGSSKDRGLMAA